MKMKLSKFAYLLVAVLAFGLFLMVVHALKKGSKGRTITMTGCLAKGEPGDEFAITKDGKKYGLKSTNVKLADHLSHKVTVIGKFTREPVRARREKHKKRAAANTRTCA